MIKQKKFGECLRLLLSILDVSTKKLSKALNVDSSLVSRWLNDKRTPSYKNSAYIENISEFLSESIQNSFQECHLNDLYNSLCENDGKNICVKEKIKRILLQSQGYSIECQKKTTNPRKVPRFLDDYSLGYHRDVAIDDYEWSSFDSFSTGPASFIDFSSEDKIILGSDNIYFASIYLLEAAAGRPCGDGKTIYISYNTDSNIIYNQDTLNYWNNAILKAIGSGWSIIYLLRLNNNIERAMNFIKFARPLIYTGKFNAYYLKNYDFSSLEKEFIVVPEIGTLYSLSTKLGSEINRAFYFKNKIAVEIFRDFFTVTLQSLAQPLIRYYSQDEIDDYASCFTENEKSIGDRYMYKYDFSILTMPEKLYSRLLFRASLPQDEVQKSLKLYKDRLNAFLTNLQYYEYKDIYLADCIKNLVEYKKLHLYCIKGYSPVNLEIQDIIELLRNIVFLLESCDHYHIAFMPQNHDYKLWYLNSFCELKERQSVIVESHDPSKSMPDIRLSIEEPMILQGFKESFREMWEHIAPVNRDKKEVINWLKLQIDSL